MHMSHIHQQTIDYMRILEIYRMVIEPREMMRMLNMVLLRRMVLLELVNVEEVSNEDQCYFHHESFF